MHHLFNIYIISFLFQNIDPCVCRLCGKDRAIAAKRNPIKKEAHSYQIEVLTGRLCSIFMKIILLQFTVRN